MLPFPFRSVPLEVLLPVQYSCPFHPEAWVLCKNSDGLILEMVCSAYLLLCPMHKKYSAVIGVKIEEP